MIAYSHEIVKISKNGCFTSSLQIECADSFKGVLSLSPCYAAIKKYKEMQKVVFYNERGKRIKVISFPIEYAIKDIVFNPCKNQSDKTIEFTVLALDQNGCSRFLLYETSFPNMTPHCCNYAICESGSRNDCKCTHKHHDDCHVKQESLNDLIESVALVEVGLAQILNAEGEKIQRVVQISDCVRELLEVNESINKTIINTTHLEQTLYQKLTIANEMHQQTLACKGYSDHYEDHHDYHHEDHHEDHY
jgi:hypothetical protein